jgi:ADP-heptose:LPS heptosyltransferase
MSAPNLQPFVFKLGRIGDMVMLTAALRVLRTRYGGPCLLVGADSWVRELYRGHPDVAQCWSIPRKAPFPLSSGWPAVLGALRASAPGPIYVFEHHAGQVRRIRRLLALSRIDPGRCLFMDEQPGTERPWLDALLDLAARTPGALEQRDYPVPSGVARLPELFVLDDDRKARDAWLRSRGWRGEPRILVQPGNHRTMGRRRMRHWRERDDKAWPVARWAELVRGLHASMPEALILLRGAQAEVPLLRAVEAAAKVPTVRVAGTGVRQLLALCDGAHSMISVDTGPAHAAAALGLPLVVLYGVQPSSVWLPRSPTGSAVIGLGAGRVEGIEAQEVLDSWRRLRAPARGRVGGAPGPYAAADPASAERADPSLSQTTSVRIEPSAFSSSVR